MELCCVSNGRAAKSTVRQTGKEGERKEGLSGERDAGEQSEGEPHHFLYYAVHLPSFSWCSVHQLLTPNSLKNKYNLNKLSERLWRAQLLCVPQLLGNGLHFPVMNKNSEWQPGQMRHVPALASSVRHRQRERLYGLCCSTHKCVCVHTHMHT